jgi:hypothetical protein
MEKINSVAEPSLKLDGIINNKYDNNSYKLSEWKIASHLEAAPDYGDDAAKTNKNVQPA